MILPWKPKPGVMIAGDHVQKMKTPGPPDFSMDDYRKEGSEMAAQRLIDSVKSGDREGVLSAIRNLLALLDTE